MAGQVATDRESETKKKEKEKKERERKGRKELKRTSRQMKEER